MAWKYALFGFASIAAIPFIGDFDSGKEKSMVLAYSKNVAQVEKERSKIRYKTASTFMGPYHAQLVRLIDGDTFIALIRVSPTVFIRKSVRISGIDTPETRRAKCEEERNAGNRAKQLVKYMMETANARATSTKLKLYDLKLGKYAGRILAKVEVKLEGTWINVGDYLIDEKLALPYNGGKKSDWCKLLKN